MKYSVFLLSPLVLLASNTYAGFSNNTVINQDTLLQASILKAPSNYISLEKQRLPFINVVLKTIGLADPNENITELCTVNNLIKTGRKSVPKDLLKDAISQASHIFQQHSERIINLAEREILRTNIDACLNFFATETAQLPNTPATVESPTNSTNNPVPTTVQESEIR